MWLRCRRPLGALKALLPFAVTNPVDTTAQALNDMTLLARNIEVMSTRGYDALIGFFPRFEHADALRTLREAIAGGCARFPDRLIALEMVADREVVRDMNAPAFLSSRTPTGRSPLCRARALQPGFRAGGGNPGLARTLDWHGSPVRTCRQGASRRGRRAFPRRAARSRCRGRRGCRRRHRLPGRAEDRLRPDRAQDRDRRRHRWRGRPLRRRKRFCDAARTRRGPSPRRRHRGRSGRADGEEGRRGDRRRVARSGLRTGRHVRPGRGACRGAEGRDVPSGALDAARRCG